MPPAPSADHPPAGPARRWRLAWWFWFWVLFALSSVPGHRLIGPRPFDWFDKVEHFGFFFLGGLLLGGGIVAAGRWPARWWLLPLAAAVVGAFDETHQLFTPGRSGLDWGDWVADVAGGSVAASVIQGVFLWRRRTRYRPAAPAEDAFTRP